MDIEKQNDRIADLENRIDEITATFADFEAFITPLLPTKIMPTLADLQGQVNEMREMMMRLMDRVNQMTIELSSLCMPKTIGLHSKGKGKWPYEEQPSEIELSSGIGECNQGHLDKMDVVRIQSRLDSNKKPRKHGPLRQFAPLPKPLSQLLPMLLEKRLVAKEVPREKLPKFTGFDMSKTCVYHMGEKGHDVDNCLVLKVKIQNLLDKGILSFGNAASEVRKEPVILDL